MNWGVQDGGVAYVKIDESQRSQNVNPEEGEVAGAERGTPSVFLLRAEAGLGQVFKCVPPLELWSH